jgi:lipooligosaccharide transport system permease protein
MWALGMVESPWFVLAVPAAALIGLTFASLGMALTTYMRSWEDFEYVPAITLPLFLFSTTFYPISQYGELSWVVAFSPLYHGVELVRAANLGQWDASIIGNVAVLVALSVVGVTLASRRIERLLLT